MAAELKNLVKLGEGSNEPVFESIPDMDRFRKDLEAAKIPYQDRACVEGQITPRRLERPGSISPNLSHEAESHVSTRKACRVSPSQTKFSVNAGFGPEALMQPHLDTKADFCLGFVWGKCGFLAFLFPRGTHKPVDSKGD